MRNIEVKLFTSRVFVAATEAMFLNVAALCLLWQRGQAREKEVGE